MTDLNALIERLSRATGLDADLDGEVALALGFVVPWFDTTNLSSKDQKTIRECSTILARGKYTETAELRADAIAALSASLVQGVQKDGSTCIDGFPGAERSETETAGGAV